MANTTISKRILISQPCPVDLEKSQYKVLLDKHKAELTFFKFFDVAGVSNKEFRSFKIQILDYSAVILTSKLAVDNYFRMAKELRLVIPDSMKYFCITESIANYLQNYIQYRKRKIFYGKIQFYELMDIINKHKDETYLFPCAEDTSLDNFQLLDKSNITYQKSIMYRSEPKDLSKDLDIKNFDMVVMFSPIGVKSFIQSFPDYNHEKIIFAAFGANTQAALKEAKIKTMIPAPNINAPSMVMAIDNFLCMDEKGIEEHNIKMEEEFLKKPAKRSSAGLKSSKTRATTTTNKTKAATKSTTSSKPTNK